MLGGQRAATMESGAEEKTERRAAGWKSGGCHRSTWRGLPRTPLHKRGTSGLKSHGVGHALPCVVPWACSSSLLSSSECGWLLPLVTVLARLLDRTPAPERSITEGMAATNTHMVNYTFHFIYIYIYRSLQKITWSI